MLHFDAAAASLFFACFAPLLIFDMMPPRRRDYASRFLMLSFISLFLDAAVDAQLFIAAF